MDFSFAVLLLWRPEQDAGHQPGSSSQRTDWPSDETDGFWWGFATPEKREMLKKKPQQKTLLKQTCNFLLNHHDRDAGLLFC